MADGLPKVALSIGVLARPLPAGAGWPGLAKHCGPAVPRHAAAAARAGSQGLGSAASAGGSLGVRLLPPAALLLRVACRRASRPKTMARKAADDLSFHPPWQAEEYDEASFSDARSFADRPNLTIDVAPKIGKACDLQRIVAYLRTHRDESTVIFVAQRGDVEEVHRSLQDLAWDLPTPIGKYHSMLSEEVREATKNGFLSNAIRVVIASKAFVTEIDKPDIRTVIHYGPPRGMEDYYAQAGLAGRDGQLAHCLMLWEPGDFDKLKKRFVDKDPEWSCSQSFVRMRYYCKVSGDDLCRRIEINKHFGHASDSDRCNACDLCKGQRRTLPTVTIDRRDFAIEAHQICREIQGPPQAQNNIIRKLQGREWRNRYPMDIIAELLKARYVEERFQERPKSFKAYALTKIGKELIRVHVLDAKPLILPTPLSVLRHEARKRRKNRGLHR